MIRNEMRNSLQIASASIVAIFMLGCASTGENLQRETARSIGGNISPEQVKVSDVDRGVTSVKWKASAPSGDYECSADDMVRRVLCIKKK
jgi:hypothetical protein